MRSHRASIAGLAAVHLLLGSACSGTTDDATRRRVATPAMGSPDGGGPKDGGGSKSGSQKKKGSPHPDRTGSDDAGNPAPGQSAPPGSTKPGRRRPASAAASRTDPSGDMDRGGDPPGYADIRRASLQGTRRVLRLILRVDGAIARSLPEGQDMTMNFRLDMPGDEEHQIYALGGRDGWEADLDNSGSFPGRFAIVGDSFVFELRWSRLGGAERFRWEAETAWTKEPSGPLAQTEFSFDRVPEYEPARFPE